MMQPMAIHPGNGIYIESENVIHDSNGFYEPFFVVERTVSDSQVKDVGEIKPAGKPAKNEINAAD